MPTLDFGGVDFRDGIDALGHRDEAPLGFADAVGTEGEFHIRDIFLLGSGVGVLDDMADGGFRLGHHLGEVHHVEVCIVVPDMKDSEAPLGEHQPAAVGRDTRQGDAAVAEGGIVDEFPRAEGACLLIEGYAIEVVLHLGVVLDELEFGVRLTEVVPVAADVVDISAVGAPEGEAVEVGGVSGDRQHLVALDVVEDEVGLGVLHLNLLDVACVEALARVVCGIDDPGLGRVPGGIYAGGEGGVRLEVHLLEVAVVGDDGSSEVLTHVELDASGVVPLGVVAVDALAVLLVAVDHVAVDEALVEVLEAALVECQVLIGDVGGRDEAVADVRIDAVLGDGDVERLLAMPGVALLLEYLNSDAAVCGEGCALHLVPLLQSGTDVFATDVPRLGTCSEAGDEVGVGAVVVDVEVQRGDVQGHGDSHVVGVNGRKGAFLDKLRGHLGRTAEDSLACGGTEDNKKDDECHYGP